MAVAPWVVLVVVVSHAEHEHGPLPAHACFSLRFVFATERQWQKSVLFCLYSLVFLPPFGFVTVVFRDRWVLAVNLFFFPPNKTGKQGQ